MLGVALPNNRLHRWDTNWNMRRSRLPGSVLFWLHEKPLPGVHFDLFSWWYSMHSWTNQWMSQRSWCAWYPRSQWWRNTQWDYNRCICSWWGWDFPKSWTNWNSNRPSTECRWTPPVCEMPSICGMVVPVHLFIVPIPTQMVHSENALWFCSWKV